IIFSVAAIIATIIIAIGISNIKEDNETITATGSAKKVIVSDLGVLNGSLTVNGATALDAYQQLQAQKPILVTYLEGKGFPEKDIEFKTMNSYANYYYNQNGQQTGISSYTATQMLTVSSTDVNKIKDISIDISSLI